MAIFNPILVQSDHIDLSKLAQKMQSNASQLFKPTFEVIEWRIDLREAISAGGLFLVKILKVILPEKNKKIFFFILCLLIEKIFFFGKHHLQRLQYTL